MGREEGRETLQCFLLMCFQACRELSKNCVLLHSIDI